MDPTLSIGALLSCALPERLHPVSAMFLEALLEGRMSVAEFLRFFSLPNSDYIPLAQCIVSFYVPTFGP